MSMSVSRTVDFDNKKDLDSLSESERRTCSDVNDFIGTDRW